MTITIDIPLKVVSEANMREHFRAKATRVRKQRTRVAFALVPYRNKLPFPCRVTFTRFGVKELDTDNLSGAFKAQRDEVAKWVGVDDGDKRYEWRYEQAKCKRGQYAVRIEIERIGEPVTPFKKEKDNGE